MADSHSTGASAPDAAVDDFAANLARTVAELIDAGTQAKREEIAHNLARIHQQAVTDKVQAELRKRETRCIIALPDLPENPGAGAISDAIGRRTGQIRGIADVMGAAAEHPDYDDESPSLVAWAIKDLTEQIDALVAALPTKEAEHE